MTRDEKIAEARRLRETVSQSEIARQLGVTQSTVWKWFNPERSAESMRRTNLKRRAAKREWERRQAAVSSRDRAHTHVMNPKFATALEAVAREVETDTGRRTGVGGNAVDPGDARRPLGPEALESRYRAVLESDAEFRYGNLILLGAACVEMAAQLEARAAAA